MIDLDYKFRKKKKKREKRTVNSKPKLFTKVKHSKWVEDQAFYARKKLVKNIHYKKSSKEEK